jgi:hypothetical protein
MWDTPNRELSVVGRWLSPDPAGSGWNQYAYPTNPNTFIDPAGLDDCVSNPYQGSCNGPGGGGAPGGGSGGGSGGGGGGGGGVGNFGCPTCSNFPGDGPSGLGVYESGAEAAWLGSGSIGWYSGANGLLYMVFGYWIPNSNYSANIPGSKLGNIGTIEIDLITPAELDSTLSNNWQLAVAGARTFISINREVHRSLTPTICGGGVFGFYGKGVTALGVKGFTGVVGEWDSHSGISGGSLSEAGAFGVGGGRIVGSGGVSSLGFVEFGEIPGWGSAGALGFTGAGGVGLGGYAEAEFLGREAGGGGYFNITSVTQCQ